MPRGGDDSGDENTASSKRTPMKPRSTPSRSSTRRVTYPQDSSDEEDAGASISKRLRNTEPHSDNQSGTSESMVGRVPHARKSTRKLTYNEAEGSDKSDDEKAKTNSRKAASSDSEDSDGKKPRRPQVAKKMAPSTAATRPVAANVRDDANETMKALMHAIKLNTSAMGDLAAEMRLLRENLVLENRKR